MAYAEKHKLNAASKTSYFLIGFVQAKLTLFIFFKIWVR